MGGLRAAFLMALCVAAACEKDVPAPVAMDQVTVEEADVIARAFEAAVEPCDGAALTALVDVENIARRAVTAAGLRKRERSSMYQGMRKEFGDLGAKLCAGFEPDVDFTLLRIRDRGGRRTPVFRAAASNGINYYELELGKSKHSGAIRIVDLYIYMSGERLSDSLAQLMTNGIGAMRSGTDIDGKLAAINAAQRGGDAAEVRRLIAALPERLRDSKQIQLIELRAMTDEPGYQQVVERLERAFPDDPALDLVSVDGYYLRKDVPGLMKVLERLDRRVGGDPYIGLLRANAYQLDPTPDNLALAETAARAATVALPDVEDAWWSLVSALLLRRDHAGVVAILDLMKARFGTTVSAEAMAGEDLWRTFLASPEYQAWLNER